MSDRITVLIVDDDPVQAASLRAHLEAPSAYRWTSETVATVADALERSRQGGLDVALVGLRLPAAGVAPLLAQLLDAAPGLAVVLLGEGDDEALARVAIPSGAQECLARSAVRGTGLVRALGGAVERARRQSELATREAMYRDHFERNLAFLCRHDLEGRILEVNSAAAASLGYGSADLRGHLLSEYLDQPTRHTFPGYLKRIQAQDFDIGLMTMRGRAGDVRVWEYRNVLRRPAIGEPYVIGHAIDVTERLHAARERREESIRDTLTGCYNRRYLERRAEDADLGPSWGCIVVDVEGVRAVNEARGTAAGDALLVSMGRFLAAHARVVDAVVRVGDDEFLLILNGCGEPETAIVAERLRERARDEGPHPFGLGSATRRDRESLHATIARAGQRQHMVRAAVQVPERRHERR